MAEQILVQLRHVIAERPGRTPEEEEFIVRIHGGFADARQEGRTEGLAEGEAIARAQDVLTVLHARGIRVPDAARERILVEKNPKRLERWLKKAAVAASVVEVIGKPS